LKLAPTDSSSGFFNTSVSSLASSSSSASFGKWTCFSHRPAGADREAAAGPCRNVNSSIERDGTDPAHNEENVIVQTITSVLLSDLQDLRIIVVNDGSMDKTGELLDANFSHEPRVHIIHQANRGKAAALSHAMSLADTELW